jgi:hypothetical protein
MVLKTKPRPIAMLEIRLLAVEPVDDLAGGTVDLVDGAGVASRDEVVARFVLVDAVDVEVVPGIAAVVT